MNLADLRIVFAGTPAFAAAHLEDLLKRRLNVVSTYSQPDRPSGRGKRLLPTPVKAAAQAHGIVVRQPAAFTADALAELVALQADLMIVVAYGLLLPPAVLAAPRLGCLNVHASLLPRWRGAAPIERAIMEGDSETGISIMQMDEGLDTGPVLARANTPIHDHDNSETLTRRLQSAGSETLYRVLEQIVAGEASATPQQHELATYARKLRKEESEINWHCSARHIHDQVRALYPRLPAWSRYRNQRLRIIETVVDAQASTADQPQQSAPGTIMAVDGNAMHVACESDVLKVCKVQLEGKNPVSVAELQNGRPDFLEPGTVLESATSHAAS